MKTTFAPVLALLSAIIDACFVGDTDTVKSGRISSERGTFRLLNANRADLEAALGDNAKEHSWAIEKVLTTLASGHHEYGTVLKAARQVARAIELPGLLTEAQALGVEVRNPKGITVRSLEGLVNAKRGELFRQTRALNAKARDLVIELEFLKADTSDVPAIADPDKGIGGSELVAAREVADKLEVALREKLGSHVKRLTQGRVTELFTSKRSAILLRGTHNLQSDLARAKSEAEKQVDGEMRRLWEKFQAFKAQSTPAAASASTSSEVAQQA